MKVVVASGWWCADDVPAWSIGAPETRSVPFFSLWYRQVIQCLAPARILVTDSASPIKPDIAAFPLLQWIELDRNYGHALDLRMDGSSTRYSGFTRSVIQGAMYALCCDADWYVYVEQDCLLFGESLLSAAIGDAETDIFLGAPTQGGRGPHGQKAAAKLQQSLMIVRRPALSRFITGVMDAPWSDAEVSPEETMRRRLPPFEYLRIPFGRSRPLDFTVPHFYVQHLTTDELAQAKGLLAKRESEAATRPHVVPQSPVWRPHSG